MTDKEEYLTKKMIGDAVSKAMKEKKLNDYDIERMTKGVITHQTSNNIRHGKTMPTMPHLFKIQRVLGIKIISVNQDTFKSIDGVEL